MRFMIKFFFYYFFFSASTFQYDSIYFELMEKLTMSSPFAIRKIQLVGEGGRRRKTFRRPSAWNSFSFYHLNKFIPKTKKISSMKKKLSNHSQNQEIVDLYFDELILCFSCLMFSPFDALLFFSKKKKI